MRHTIVQPRKAGNNRARKRTVSGVCRGRGYGNQGGSWISTMHHNWNSFQMRSSSKKGCTGEYCFKAQIKSSLGHMTSYKTAGCASFDVEAELAEELDPTGCARFTSENLEVEACFQTKDRAAIGRARANQQVREPPARQPGASRGRSKG